ncbi:hypothetical protein J2751_001940 [Halorubrum alkaliphilum]|uniref:Uncharacterized protein n=1 Tax=Halorubrum alkaliphilum TaxID=261290 RepID=A0A8T4GEJ4_9EURY|nr:hypothetical protein [Halorubrum alkaliphilum]MBP1922924.1 hypothetical protein [Halorubrum alkaliphilum]
MDRPSGVKYRSFGLGRGLKNRRIDRRRSGVGETGEHTEVETHTEVGTHTEANASERFPTRSVERAREETGIDYGGACGAGGSC